MSLVPAFSLHLSQKPLPKTVALGKLDGLHSSLVGGTSTGKVFVHTAHTSVVAALSAQQHGRMTKSEMNDVALLNVNQTVRAVTTGKMLFNEPNKDVLVIGTASHVLAYDVDNNKDLFYREVPDGVNTVIIGQLGANRTPLAICGGNCAIQGFTSSGHDPFWTVTGDNVTAIILCDYDGDGENELIVGSDDFDLRVFKGDTIVDETSESDAIICLHHIDGNRFAYALANGTLGVYCGMERLWRIKSKNTVVCMHMYDIDSDDQQELTVGWGNGKLDFRRVDTGEVIIKESFGASIAGIGTADYRQDGCVELITASVDGEVRAFLAPRDGGIVKQSDPSQAILHDYELTRQNLLMELSNYEANEMIAEQRTDSLPLEQRQKMGAIPANTHLQTTLYVNPGSPEETPCVELYVRTSNETIVRAVMIFAEGIFSGESHVVHPNIADVSPELRVQLRPIKDLQVELHVKALVGQKGSTQFHVFELSRTLPRFAMYALCNEHAPEPESYCTFTVSERPARLALWVNENFLLQEEVSVDSNENLDARFFSLRGAGMLFVQMTTNGEVFIRCNDMELAGNVVAAIADFFGIDDLNSTAEYPKEIEKLQHLQEKANEIYMVRDQLSGDVADLSSLIKGLLIRAEDCRLMSDMANMKRYYTHLHNINQELLAQYKVRCNNQEELLSHLKQINLIIQRAARLRVGKSKTAVVTACREAIQNENHDALPKIIRYGAL